MSILEISLPIQFSFSDKEFKNKTDALQDFYISISRTLNYMFKTIVLLESKNSENILPSRVIPNLKDFLGNPINSPILEINENSKEFQIDYIEELFKSSFFRIASFFENYLNDLMHELFWHNELLLKKEDTSIKASKIFQFKSLQDFENDLIDNLTMSILMKPYKELVRTFQNKFYIGIHNKKSPMQFEEVHNFIELRNLIAHNNGYSNKHYLNRVKGYDELNFPGVLTQKNSHIQIDFNQLYKTTKKLLLLAEYIDSQANDRWTTSANI